jgi:hypothetical protein
MLPIHQICKGKAGPAELLMDLDTGVVQHHLGSYTGLKAPAPWGRSRLRSKGNVPSCRLSQRPGAPLLPHYPSLAQHINIILTINGWNL